MTLKEDRVTTPSALEDEVQQLQASLNKVREELAYLKENYDAKSAQLAEQANELLNSSCSPAQTPAYTTGENLTESPDHKGCDTQSSAAEESFSKALATDTDHTNSSVSEAKSASAGQACGVPFTPTPSSESACGVPFAQTPASKPYKGGQKDHIAAGLLAIFLGAFGVHKFYLGYMDVGFIMLAVSVIGSIFTFGLAGFVIWIIALVEGILYLTSSQDTFVKKYVEHRCEWF